jgi:1-phosphofructokinase/tagatose 6-phosphate kinase
MPTQPAQRGAYLAVCLNPVIQKTLVYKGIRKGEVNRSSEHRVDASGKGVNVARVLAQSGRRAIQLTQAGGATREWFLAMCEADGLELRWVESGSEIRFCYTIIDAADHTATELVEEARRVAPGTGELVLAEFDRALPECGSLVISGTKAPGFEDGIFPEMARRARAAGKLVVLDIKGKDLAGCLPHRPDVAKPNLEELLQSYAPEKAERLRGGELPDDRALRDLVAGIGAEYWEKWGTRLVVTRGHRSTLYWDGGGLREYQGAVVTALNPTGSGDSFTAGLAATLAEGGGIEAAVAEGSRLGALNAQRLKPGSID